MAADSQADKSNKSEYDDMTAITRGFTVARKISSKKKDAWDEMQPIEKNMKKRVEGLWVWSPRAAEEQWIQYTDDMPPDSLALFLRHESQGELDLIQVLSYAELWEDYIQACSDAYDKDDGSDGEPCMLSGYLCS